MIKKIICLLFLIGSLLSMSTPSFGAPYDKSHAVLIAGSNGFDNYRHHANIAHAYQLVRKYGMPAQNIIVFMYNDVPFDEANPFPGKLFNKPSSKYDPPVDVYAGIQIDYEGDDITPQNFLNVITGDAKAMKHIGSGRVLNSTYTDHVFIYFSDHGGEGIICFPNDKLLTANQLNDALLKMYSRRMYRRLFFYLEACESGSMFDNILPEDIGVYAVTGSKPTELHWAEYCPPNDDVVNGKHMGVCLSGDSSSALLQNADQAGPFEALDDQFAYMNTHMEHSTPQRYGQLNWTDDPIGEYEGNLHPSSQSLSATNLSHTKDLSATKNSSSTNDIDNNDVEQVRKHAAYKAYNEYDAKLVSMFYNYIRSLGENSTTIVARNSNRPKFNINGNYNYNTVEYLTRIRDELNDRISIITCIENMEYKASISNNVNNNDIDNTNGDYNYNVYNAFNIFFEECANKNVYAIKYFGRFKEIYKRLSPSTVLNFYDFVEDSCDTMM